MNVCAGADTRDPFLCSPNTAHLVPHKLPRPWNSLLSTALGSWPTVKDNAAAASGGDSWQALGKGPPRRARQWPMGPHHPSPTSLPKLPAGSLLHLPPRTSALWVPLSQKPARRRERRRTQTPHHTVSYAAQRAMAPSPGLSLSHLHNGLTPGTSHRRALLQGQAGEGTRETASCSLLPSLARDGPVGVAQMPQDPFRCHPLLTPSAKKSGYYPRKGIWKTENTRWSKGPTICGPTAQHPGATNAL